MQWKLIYCWSFVPFALDVFLWPFFNSLECAQFAWITVKNTIYFKFWMKSQYCANNERSDKGLVNSGLDSFSEWKLLLNTIDVLLMCVVIFGKWILGVIYNWEVQMNNNCVHFKGYLKYVHTYNYSLQRANIICR